jgi:hypothetical protein
VRLSLPALRRPAAAVAALVLLTACGNVASDTDGDRTDRLAPVAVVKAAAATTAEAGSSRFALESVTDLGGQTVEVSGSGEFDPATRQGTASFSLPAGGGTIDQRFLGDDLYITMPGQPGFYRVSLSDVSGSALARAVDPTASLQALEGVSDDVEEVGSDTVRGDDTTRYRGTIDPQQALEQLDPSLRQLAEQQLAAGEIEALPFEAWIDDDGRLRRFVATVDVPGSEATGGQAISSKTTLELYDFGVEVDVEAPPADQVQDGGPLLDAFRGPQG